jgi:hypothetical protein
VQTGERKQLADKLLNLCAKAIEKNEEEVKDAEYIAYFALAETLVRLVLHYADSKEHAVKMVNSIMKQVKANVIALKTAPRS